jgi:hypothetical protein
MAMDGGVFNTLEEAQQAMGSGFECSYQSLDEIVNSKHMVNRFSIWKSTKFGIG